MSQIKPTPKRLVIAPTIAARIIGSANLDVEMEVNQRFFFEVVLRVISYGYSIG